MCRSLRNKAGVDFMDNRKGSLISIPALILGFIKIYSGIWEKMTF